MMKSFRDELRCLLIGRGMPYEKIAFVVSLVITVLFTVMMGMNYAKDTPITVIDLDNSRYSRELVQKLDVSRFLKVQAVLNSPADPKVLMYRDKNYAVVYLPEGLEKKHYNGEACEVGVFYDNTSSASLSGVREALNEIVADANNPSSGSRESLQGGMLLVDRLLFNPHDSAANGEVVGFLTFFSSMFFAFAMLSLVPRLKMEGKYYLTLRKGMAFDLMQRAIPYCCLWLGANFLGYVILRFWGDINFNGSIVLFFVVQALFIWGLSLICILFGWDCPHPGAAGSRMILFVPGGFIFGGYGVPLTLLPEWVRWFNQIFPLTWEFKFIRDVVFRGAGFMDCAVTIGQFLLYLSIVAVLFLWKVHKEQERLADREKDMPMVVEA